MGVDSGVGVEMETCRLSHGGVSTAMSSVGSTVERTVPSVVGSKVDLAVTSGASSAVDLAVLLFVVSVVGSKVD